MESFQRTHRTCAIHRRCVHRRSPLLAPESVRVTSSLSSGLLHARRLALSLRLVHLATSRLPCGVQVHCGGFFLPLVSTLDARQEPPSDSDGDDVRCRPHRRALNMYRLMLWGAPRLLAALLPAHRLLPFRRWSTPLLRRQPSAVCANARPNNPLFHRRRLPSLFPPHIPRFLCASLRAAHATQAAVCDICVGRVSRVQTTLARRCQRFLYYSGDCTAAFGNLVIAAILPFCHNSEKQLFNIVKG